MRSKEQVIKDLKEQLNQTKDEEAKVALKKRIKLIEQNKTIFK